RGGEAGAPRSAGARALPREGAPARVRGDRRRRAAAEGRGLQRGRDLRAHRLGRRRRRPGAAGRGPPGAAMRLEAVDAVEAPRPLGVLKTLHYRPELFGRPYSDALDLAMRGPSEWSAGERELFAGFVS